MFKKILLVYSGKRNELHLKSLEKVKFYLNESKIDFMDVQIDFFNPNLLGNVDLVFSVGGDGVFIRVSHYLKEIPILGINSDSKTSEGGLCSLNENNLDLIKNIFGGECGSINRERIDVFINEKKIPEIALNEIYVGTKNQFHTSRYVIKHGGLEEEHRSSGVLVATGSGSNVWYKSAGGEPFSFDEKKLKFLVREPFTSRLFKPKIIEGTIEVGESIMFDSKRCMDGVIALDSNVTYDFNEGTNVKLEVSKFPLKVLIHL